jgi:hypothetical protein
VTDEALEVVLTDLKSFSRGITEAVSRIAELESEIAAIQSICEKNGLATREELEAAVADAVGEPATSIAAVEPVALEFTPRKIPRRRALGQCRKRPTQSWRSHPFYS